MNRIGQQWQTEPQSPEKHKNSAQSIASNTRHKASNASVQIKVSYSKIHYRINPRQLCDSSGL